MQNIRVDMSIIISFIVFVNTIVYIDSIVQLEKFPAMPTISLTETSMQWTLTAGST